MQWFRRQAERQGLKDWGYGMALVRFIRGTQTINNTLEEKLTRFLSTVGTILYPSCSVAMSRFRSSP